MMPKIDGNSTILMKFVQSIAIYYL